MRSLLLSLGSSIFIFFISCSTNNDKGTPVETKQSSVSAIEKKEIIKLDSLSDQLEKANSEIDQKAQELEDALKEIEQ